MAHRSFSEYIGPSEKRRPDGIASYGRPERIAELEAEFRVMLQATNRSPATITAYMAGLTALRRYLPEHGMPTAVDAVARDHIEATYAGWMEGGYAAAS